MELVKNLPKEGDSSVMLPIPSSKNFLEQELIDSVDVNMDGTNNFLKFLEVI